VASFIIRRFFRVYCEEVFTTKDTKSTKEKTLTAKNLARQSRNQKGFGTGKLTAKGAKNAKKNSEYLPQRRKGRKITVKRILQDNSSFPSELGVLCAFAGGISGSEDIQFPEYLSATL